MMQPAESASGDHSDIPQVRAKAHAHPELPADLRALIDFVGAMQGSSDADIDATAGRASQHPERARACLVGLARAAIDRMVAPSAKKTEVTPLIPPTDNTTPYHEAAITMTDLMEGSYICFLRSPAEPNVGPLTDTQKAVDGVTPLAPAIRTIMELQPEYGARHGIEAASVLTIMNDGDASHVADYLADQIRGKVVVELGCGTGRLALHLGRYAKHVYCIEANPAWTWAFVELLFRSKPRNVSFLFGAAEEFIGRICGDVALFCTHSDVSGLRQIGAQFAPVVIDVYEVESGGGYVAHPNELRGSGIGLKPPSGGFNLRL